MKSQDHAGIKNSPVGITWDQLPDDPNALGSRQDQSWDQPGNADSIRLLRLSDPEIPKNRVIVNSQKKKPHTRKNARLRTYARVGSQDQTSRKG